LATLHTKLIGGAVLQSRSVVAYLPESAIAATLGKIQADHPQVDIGSYPFTREGRIGTTLVVRGTSPAVLTAVVTKIKAIVVAAGETPHEQE